MQRSVSTRDPVSRSTRMQRSVSSNGTTGYSTSSLQIIDCPYCGIQILKLVSKSVRNPGRVFYKCPNYKIKKGPNCYFYMWEDDYKEYLDQIGLLSKDNTDEMVQPETGGQSHCNNGSNESIDNFMEQLKSCKKIEDSQLVICVEHIKWLVVIICIVVFSILIILVLMMVVQLYK